MDGITSSIAFSLLKGGIMAEGKKPGTPGEDKSIKPVVTSKPPVRKKNNMFKEIVTDVINDDIPTIFEYIVRDVIVPTTVSCISQCAHTGISMFFKMDPGTSSRGYYRSDDSGWWNAQIKNDYGRYYRGDDHPYRPGSTPPWEAAPQPGPRYSNSPMHDYLDYPIGSYNDAQRVLQQMRDWLTDYDAISVADFYKLVNYQYDGSWAINRSTLSDYGWFDISTVTIANRAYKGRVYYYLTMPNAVYIKG